MEFAVTQSLEIAYEVDGPEDGTSVVAVHGWPDSPGTWDLVVPILHEAGCRVFRPYMRGFGPTRFRRPDTPRSGQTAAFCQDLSEFIEVLGLEGAVIAGHDWGARGGYAVSAVRPELVSGLVAMSVAYGTSGPGATVSPEQAHAFWYQWYFTTELGRAALDREPEALCRHLWRQWSPSWSFDPDEFERAAAAWANPDWSGITTHSYAQRWGEVPGDPELAELERDLARIPPINVPAIVLHGEDDGGALVSASEGRDAFFSSTYSRRTLSGVGHFIPREAPREAATAILDVVAAAR
jgi:pimeloyl-ACP methyl ester carboxylesterase